VSKAPFEVFKLKLIPLTPVHVSDGNPLPPYEYVVSDGELLVIDPLALFEALPEAQEAFINAVEAGPFHAREALAELAERYDLKPAVSWRAPVTKSFEAYVQAAIKKRRGKLELHTFPRSLKGPYLPGSSLKGAIRTAFIFERSAEELKAKFDEYSGAWLGEYNLAYTQKFDEDRKLTIYLWQKEKGTGRIRLYFEDAKNSTVNQSFEGFLLGNNSERITRKSGEPIAEPEAEIPRDPFRTLFISDSTPLPKTRFTLVERHGPPDPETGKTSRRFRLLTEVWYEGPIKAELRIHKGLREHKGSLLHLRREGKNYVPAPTHPPTLEDIAGGAYDRYLELAYKDRKYFEHLGLHKATQTMRRVIKTIETCLDENNSLKDPPCFPLRLGFGSSALAMRLAEFIEYKGTRAKRINPRTRYLADGEPLGWVLVEVEKG